VIFDAVGGATSGRGLEVLALGGTLVIYGAASGSPPQFSPTAMGGFALKMQTIAGYSMMPSLADANLGRLLREDFARLYALVESGALKPVIGRRLPLSEAAEAHRLIESRQSTGKILLVP
jgi:NADPH2:quinone reductase